MAKKDKKVAEKEKETPSSQIIQKFKQSPFLYIGSILILVLVTVAFVGGDLITRLSRNKGGGDLTFGYYDKAPISWVPGNMFTQYHEQASRYYQSQGIDINDMRTSADIWRQSYDMTVAHTAIMQMMKRSNYSAPKKTVDRHVAQLPNFQENGRFSPALYKQMSESSRNTLWRQVQEELTKMMFFTDFSELLVPSTEAVFIAKMASYMRSFNMVSLKIDNYPEAEYLAYADEKADLFRTIRLSKITLNSSEREAKKVLDSIRNGVSTFEDAARSQSQDNYADRGGDMGALYAFELEREIPDSNSRDAVFALHNGDLSDIIHTGGGWVFFRIDNELTPSDFSDASVMDRVRSYLRNYDRGRMEDWAIDQAKDFIAEAELSGFENAAAWWNLERNSFGPLPVNYGGVDLFTSLESFNIPGFTAQDLQSLSRNENFWKIAFSTQLNTLCEPLVQGNNVLVLLPVEEINNEDALENEISYYYSSYWLNTLFERSIQYYFLSNERMDDRFWDTYFRVFAP